MSPRPPPRTATPPTSWTGSTPEGIDVKPVYIGADRDAVGRRGLPAGQLPGRAAVHPRARTRRCTSTSRGPSGSTPGSPPPRSPTRSTAATWPPARRACRSPSTWPPTAATTPTTRGCGRRRHGRCGDRLDPRHAAAVRRHRPVDGVGVDDDERRGAADPGAVRRGRRGAGRAAGEAGRDHPERHPQRVHGPQHLHLSAEAVDADHLRHLRLHQRQDAEVQLDLDLRLPHPGGRCDSRSGAGLHAGRRRRVHQGRPRRRAGHRQVRAAAVVLLGHRDELLHGGRQAARRPAAVERAGRRSSSPRTRSRCRCAPIRRPRAGR